VIVGTRGSALALWQTHHVVGLVKTQVKVETIVTRGDVDRSSRLQGAQLEKGFFTAELEAALREKRIDFAVHSLKDLPTRLPKDLDIAAVLERASPCDRLLVREDALGTGGLPLKTGARVGASSLRREALLKLHAPQAKATLLRGNVPTRVKKLMAGDYDAIILAAAGLSRLNLETPGLKVFDLNPKKWIPAPGQGAIAVECRAGDTQTLDALKPLLHAATQRATRIERELLRVFEGGCSAPFGAFCEGDAIWLGAEVDGKWRQRKLPLPAEPDEKFLHDAIAQISQGESNDDESWLHRPV
jgi:hydroxymethylbilane synthase